MPKEPSTATFEMYTFEDRNGNKILYRTNSAKDALEVAATYRLRWIAQIYEWSHSKLVKDYTVLVTAGNLAGKLKEQ